MAANGFSVTIEAVDKASARIDQINKRIAAMQAPAKRVEQSLKRFGDVSGVTAMSRRMEDFGRATFGVWANMSRLPPVLGAVTGTAAIAGVAQMTRAWAAWGQTLSQTAARTGLPIEKLQGLQNAARLAGSSAEALSGGVATLRDNLVDAVGGRAPQVIGMMNALGVAWNNANGSARDVTKVLPQVADKIAAMRDPTLQLRAATALFGGSAEALLPFLKRGAAGIADLERQAKSYGLTTQKGEQTALAYREAEVRLDLATQGLTNTLSERLAPSLTSALNGMSKFLSTSALHWAQTVSGWEATLDGFLVFLGGRFALKAASILGSMWWASPRLLAAAAGQIPAAAAGAVGAGLATLLYPNTSIQSGDVESRELQKALTDLRSPGGGPEQSAIRGLRQNNPLNLKYVPGQPYVTGSGGGFGIYPDMASGVAATEAQLLRYQDVYGLTTLRGLVNRWSPADDGNDVAAIMGGIGKKLGIGPDTPLDLHNQATAAALISAWTPYETAAVSPTDVQKGVAMALGQPVNVANGTGSSLSDVMTRLHGQVDATIKFQNAPAGTTVAASSSGELMGGAPRIIRAFPDVALP